MLDLGAHYGLFAHKIVDRFDCGCVAVEPSPEPFEGIPATGRISKFNLAIVAEPGEYRFHVREQSTASALSQRDKSDHHQPIMVKGVSLEQFLRDLGWDGVDLMKCDIEGAEIDVLAATSDECLSSIKQMSIEFHDFCGITPQEVVEQTLRRLEGLGFSYVRMSRVGHQDTWLINRKLCVISSVELLYIRTIVRNWFGLRRVVSRLFGMTR